MDKIILLDGNSLSYRAFYAMPALQNKNGLYTNSVYGFTLMLERMLEDIKPKYALVAFDKGKQTFRHKTYQDYKGTRDKTPSELVEQFGYVRELLDSYGIKYEEHFDYEADDIIGSYAKLAEKAGLEVIIISGDKDLTQLASDNITIYYTKRGVTEVDHYTPEFINEKYGLSPKQIIDMKGLMGDKSDNIPGIAGIGEKTAIKLLAEYKTVENVLDNIDNISGKKLKERLAEGKEDALLSKELATIFTEVPVENKLEDLTFSENRSKKKELFEKLEFVSFLKKLAENDDVDVDAKEEKELEIINADEKTELSFENSSLHIECFTEDYHNSDVVNIAVYEDETVYIFSEDNFFENKFVRNYLESDAEKVVYDYKKILYIAKRNGISDIAGNVFDVKIAAYLLDVTVKTELDKIVFNTLGNIIKSEEEIYGKGVKRTLPTNQILYPYLAQVEKSII